MNNFKFVVARAYTNGIPPLVTARADGWEAWDHFFRHVVRKSAVTCLMFDGIDYITRSYDPQIGLEQ